ncbi:MAG: hypothetical protein ACRD5J_14305 [Nitrososphaeraceae archaeon]
MIALFAIYPIFLVLFAPYNAMATSFWEDLGRSIDRTDANFDRGVNAGRSAGIDDAQDGRNSDSQCPPNDSLSWCAGYKLGYLDGYRSANVVGGN